MSADALPLATPESLAGLHMLRSPVWVFDIDASRVAWANGEAIRMWGARTLEDLLARDFSNMSQATQIRLRAYQVAFTEGKTRKEQWTFYPGDTPCVVDCECSGVRLPGGGVAMLVEGRVLPTDGVDRDTLRMVEALRHTGVMVSLYDLEGAPIMRNPAAIHAYGEPGATPLLSILFDEGEVAERLRSALERGETFSIETPMRTRIGVRLHGLDARITTDPATGGRAILVNERSIEERVRAERLLAREQAALRAMIDNFPFPIWFKDLDGRFIAANTAFARFCGRDTPEDIVGRTDFDVWPKAVAQANATADASVLDSRAPVSVEEERELTGERCWYDVVKAPVADAAGHLLGTVGFRRDITERRRAQEALRKASEDLVRSNAELEQFAYVASHDLRQPLRTVASFLTLLEKHLGGALDEEGREYLDFARTGAQRMDRMIVDLLDYSRVGRKIRPLEPVPLGEAMQEALSNLEAAILEAEAAVRIAPDLPTLHADRFEIVRLFQNLIGNAVKYRAPGRTPLIDVAARLEPNGWEISVTDNGIGIASEHTERIFGVFQRLHGRDEYEGTGIGLAVCRKIVEHHGGTIAVTSEPGRGSTFHVRLPKDGIIGETKPDVSA